jgi:hypothetical protein
MNTPIMAPNAYDADMEAIRRRQAFAESLKNPMAQSGQMVGNHYVPFNPLAGLADILRAKWGREESAGATEDQKALAEKLRGQNQAEMGQFTDLLGGKAAQTIQPLTPNDDEGNVNPAIQTQAQAPDLNQAYKFAAGAQNPALQQFGMQGMMTNAENQAKLAQALQQRKAMSDMWTSSGGDAQKFMAIGGDPTFAKQMAEAPLMGKEKLVNVNGQMVGEHTGQAVGSIVPKQFDQPSAVTEYEYAKKQGYKGSLEQFMLGQKRAGAANMSVSVAGPENKFNQDIGAGLAKEALSTLDSARAAPELVANARSIKAAIDKGAITGSGADTRLALQKMLESAGMVGPGKAASTQELMSGLSKLTLGGIKSSGLGGGNGFTDKDREFLNSAIGGQISDTPENLRRVADLSERVALANHAKGTQVLSRWQQNPSLKNVAQDISIDALPKVQGMPDQSAFAAEMARRGLK